MPNKHTFLIQPIAELLARYVGKGWIDPFAGYNSPAEITNDLNPKCPTTYHMKALDFLRGLNGSFNGVLFDPPYSTGQVKECYESVGIRFMQNDAQMVVRWTPEKVEIARLIKPGGYAISFGWNSNGIGIKYGFQIEEILLVAHGGAHNDTIVTVERKIQTGLINGHSTGKE